MIATGALIASGLASALGAGLSAYNRKRAQDEESRYYNQARDFLNSQYYRDPLTTVGNQSLLKAARKNYEDNLEALNNRAVAGGATMENALAARQANNENLDRLYGQLLQGEDARREAINRQKMSLEGQHSQNLQNNFRENAQNWQAWGAQMGQSALSLGSSYLLDGGTISAREWAKSAPDVSELTGQLERSALYPQSQLQAPVGGLRTPGVVGPKETIRR